MRRCLSLRRRLMRALRCRAYLVYVGLAYPGISWGRNVQIGRGVRLRAFDGGRITIGDGARISDLSLVVAQGGVITIGERCELTRGVTVVALEHIAIGAGTLIAEYATIRDQDHRHTGDQPLSGQGFAIAPIEIGREVWIGAKATVTRGVTIADHAVVGANAVVTRSIDARGVYAGAPARRLPT